MRETEMEGISLSEDAISFDKKEMYTDLTIRYAFETWWNDHRLRKMGISIQDMINKDSMLLLLKEGKRNFTVNEHHNDSGADICTIKGITRNQFIEAVAPIYNGQVFKGK